MTMTSRTEYCTQTPKKSTLFSGEYLHNHWTLDIGVLGYIGIVRPKEHSPEVRSFPPGTPCIYIYIYIYVYSDGWGDSLFQNVGTWTHGFKVQSTTVCTKSCIANLTLVHLVALSALHRTYIIMVTLLTSNFFIKGKAIPLWAWTRPEGSRSLRLPDFKTVSTWRW